jgi:hypothetical protein
MNNQYPIFIPSKGRADTRLTMKAFDAIGVSYTVVIEEQQYDDYAVHIPKERLLVLPHRDKGLTVTRNWIWDYAESKGYKRFWTFDDNIMRFYRLWKNTKHTVADGTFLRVLEDFVDRYENVPIAGMNYQFFTKQRQVVPPFYLNTRVYSNMLIDTFLRDPEGNKVRNALFFNDDTDLCLRVMKMGYCIIQFNSFLVDKARTMTVKGGMTDYYKETDKRMQFAQELFKAHPDVVKITWKFGRWHHQVDYKPFKVNKLKLKAGVVIPDAPNNYGMVLVKREDPKTNEGVDVG